MLKYLQTTIEIDVWEPADPWPQKLSIFCDLFHLFCLLLCGVNSRSNINAGTISTLGCTLKVEPNSLSEELWPTYWSNGLNTHRGFTEGPRPLNTRTPGRSNYLGHNWKCQKCWWWVAHITAWEGDKCFFQLTHIYTCGAGAYLYTFSLYLLPIPCWCLETFSFGYWFLSKPNPNRSEERKKWPN